MWSLPQGTNTVSTKELLDQRWETSKGRRLILWHHMMVAMPTISLESVQTRLYELELAKKYDFITIGWTGIMVIEN